MIRQVKAHIRQLEQTIESLNAAGAKLVWCEDTDKLEVHLPRLALTLEVKMDPIETIGQSNANSAS